MRALPVFVLAVTVLASGAQGSFYQYDDGDENSGISTFGSATFNTLFLTRYSVGSGGETLTSIDIAWGAATQSNLPNGLVADVLLMSDPNGDGNPDDAAILQSIAGLTTSSGTTTFINYGLSPLTLAAGTNFFAGAFIHDVPTGSSWAGLDTGSTGHGADNWWNVAIASPIGTHVPLSVFGANSTFLVRVNAQPVPEPATMAALAAGALMLVRRRRR